MAVIVTADFFTPVVDDAYTFGRIAATNALSDIYAMGGEPLVAREPARLAARQAPGRAGGARCCAAAWTWAARRAATWRAAHSIDDPEPKYGMAVTGTADPAALLRIDAGQPGLPLQPDQADRHRRAQRLAQGDRRDQRRPRST